MMLNLIMISTAYFCFISLYYYLQRIIHFSEEGIRTSVLYDKQPSAEYSQSPVSTSSICYQFSSLRLSYLQVKCRIFILAIKELPVSIIRSIKLLTMTRLAEVCLNKEARETVNPSKQKHLALKFLLTKQLYILLWQV